MSSVWGNNIKISVFGESHGENIGVVIDAPPAGIKIDTEYILLQMSRRAPGLDDTATKRKESDFPKIISGVKNGITTGAPLTAIIENSDSHSKDYSELEIKPRPSHADYAAHIHYGGFEDVRGGGHFSGRLTAPIVFAGSLLRIYLKQMGITIGGHIERIGNVTDERFSPAFIDEKELNCLSGKTFAVRNEITEQKMRNEILSAAKNGDSVGGILEIAVTGIDAGFGNPMFNGVENVISSAVFGIPAVKGIEFGDGFDFAKGHGSNSNDEMYIENGKVKCKTNHCGGITGGITNGMPIIFRVAFKPTPSVSFAQNTVNLKLMQNDTLTVKGRHDPCVVPRALAAVEAMTAIAVVDLLKEVPFIATV